MLTAGIDLSADPKKTGVAAVQWDGNRCRVESVDVGRHDDQGLRDAIASADKTGIDCPFGWPSAFVAYIVAHHAGGRELVAPPTRHPLTHRETDRHVTAVTGIRPLSVAADRIGSAAMRCAALLSAVAANGHTVDRTGRTGSVVEVYPAASLHLWGLPHQGYKGSAGRQARSRLVDGCKVALPWLDLAGHEDSMVADDDALDAVLCAVMAGLVLLDRCRPIPDEQHDAARVEGWIALPNALPVI